jgi:hypothetical protein
MTHTHYKDQLDDVLGEIIAVYSQNHMKMMKYNLWTKCKLVTAGGICITTRV